MSRGRPRIVVLGSGFGGAYCAQELERRLRETDAEILLLDRNNYFVFYPLLVEAGTGSLEPRHTVVSSRSFLRRSSFRRAEVLGIDTVAREVRYRAPGTDAEHTAGYDHLVVALGSVTRMPPIPGLAEHGFGMKSLTDAVALRDRAIQMLELADATDDPAARRALLHFVVVGANFTGVEVAGEFLVFLREASRQYRSVSRDECSVTLVEIADRILSALDPDLSKYARERMEQRGIRVRLRSSVREIRPERVLLEDGGVIDAHTTIWCAGIAAPPILGSLGLPVDERGYLSCTPDLRVEGHDSIWGIGDCAVNPDPDGRPYPATAQHAVRQGVHLARNLVRVLRDETPRPFVHDSLGSLAALGCRTGVAKVGGIKLSGFAAWFLWRTVYLFKMPGWSRRLRVALEWAVDLVFRRDFVELGIHRPDRTDGRAMTPPPGEPANVTPAPPAERDTASQDPSRAVYDLSQR
jgi:NADH dehydrogenase